MLPSADPNQNRYELSRYQFENGVNQKGIAYKRTPENNVGSARALTDLMEMIFKGEVVDQNACNSMLEILLKQQLNDRIPRDLPVGTPVAHKTGSFLGVRNDTGIIYINEKSHVVVTVLSYSNEGDIKKDKQSQKLIRDEIDKIIGEIAFLAYDQFI
jgi:beta-lactamase class A